MRNSFVALTLALVFGLMFSSTAAAKIGRNWRPLKTAINKFNQFHLRAKVNAVLNQFRLSPKVKSAIENCNANSIFLSVHWATLKAGKLAVNAESAGKQIPAKKIEKIFKQYEAKKRAALKNVKPSTLRDWWALNLQRGKVRYLW